MRERARARARELPAPLKQAQASARREFSPLLVIVLPGIPIETASALRGGTTAADRCNSGRVAASWKPSTSGNSAAISASRVIILDGLG